MTNLQQNTLASAIGSYDKRSATGAQRKADVFDQPLLPDTESQPIDNERQHIDRVLVQTVMRFWVCHLPVTPAVYQSATAL
jgi:hypothetical protein